MGAYATPKWEEAIMATSKISRNTRQSLPMSILVIVAVCGLIVGSGTARAADPTTSEAALAEMQVYPESARAAGWAMMKSTDLNKKTALPSKTRELIGLAVAAQIPCQYCVYYHAKAAKAAGASEEEIREAVHQASLTRHWSTVLYGNQVDLIIYKADTDAAFK
jgi:AhpD family alkylhydroperoxidase